MNEENSTAQEQNAAAEQTRPEVKSGAEARIQELYAKTKDFERQLAEKDAQMTALLQTFAAGPQQSTQTQSAPQVDLDPEEVKKMGAYMDPKIQELQARAERLERQLVAQQFQNVQGNLPSEVMQRAQDLQLAWNRQGKKGWIPEDAVRYALGEFYERKAMQGQADFARQNHNQGSQQVSMQSAPAPVQQQRYQLPKNIDSLPLHEQLAAYEKAGIGDIPLE